MMAWRFSGVVSFFVSFQLIPAQTSLIKSLYAPPDEDIRSVYFYGYVNNEHYKHYLPGTRVALKVRLWQQQGKLLVKEILVRRENASS